LNSFFKNVQKGSQLAMIDNKNETTRKRNENIIIVTSIQLQSPPKRKKERKEKRVSEEVENSSWEKEFF